MSIPEVTMNVEGLERALYLCEDEEGMTAWRDVPMLVNHGFDHSQIWTEDNGQLIADSGGMNAALVRNLVFPVIASEVRNKIVRIRTNANTRSE